MKGFKGLLVVVLMIAEWIVLVAGTKLHELIVGAISVALSAAFLFIVCRSAELDLTFSASDLVASWRLPWFVLTDLGVVLAVLAKDIFGGVPSPSLFRVSKFATEKDDPRLVARRVLATVYTTSTPNAIVVGIDYEQNRMLFHQLERSPLPKMITDLGAKI